MKVKDIIDLPVKEITDENAHLYLWITNNYLQEGLITMKSWGFNYKTMITWAKDKFGLGQYFRGKTEHCLFGVKGMIPYRKVDGKRQQGTTLIYAPRGKHSKKPNEIRDIILKVSGDLPRIELFTRREEGLISIHEGWDTWGNEA
jgi:N6-adenosine-specific RNA methylase IME4